MPKSRVRVRHVRIKRRRYPRFGKEILIMLAMLAVIIAAGVWRVAIHEFGHKDDPHSPTASGWKRYSPGGSQLSLFLPGEPQSEDVHVPETLKSNVKQISRYTYSDEKFQAAVWDISYFDGVSADIQQAAEGARQTIMQSEGVTEYQDSSTPASRSGRSGLLIKGTFKRHEQKMELEALLLGDGPRLWQVIVTHQVSDPDARLASKRILDSVSFEHP